MIVVNLMHVLGEYVSQGMFNAVYRYFYLLEFGCIKTLDTKGPRSLIHIKPLTLQIWTILLGHTVYGYQSLRSTNIWPIKMCTSKWRIQNKIGEILPWAVIYHFGRVVFKHWKSSLIFHFAGRFNHGYSISWFINIKKKYNIIRKTIF